MRFGSDEYLFNTNYFIFFFLFRETKRKTFEWFHELVDKRFKRFGSAKILRAVYKQRPSSKLAGFFSLRFLARVCFVQME